MSADSPERECYTDFALQEYAAGRLDTDVRADVAGHLGTCRECSRALVAFVAEARVLCSTLVPVGHVAIPNPPSDEVLALYLDGALDDEAASALEALFSKEPALLGRLLSIRAEVNAVRQETDDGAPTVKPEPQGLILKMPKRVLPVSTLLTGRRASGGRSD